MKLFNLTDVATPELKARGWVNLPLVVGPVLIMPGDEIEVANTELIRRDIGYYTRSGALAVGARPPEYLVAKARSASDLRLAALERTVRDKRKEK